MVETTDIAGDMSIRHKTTIRLIEILLDMPEDELRRTLKDLERDQADKCGHPESEKSAVENLRKHPRKTSLIPVDCSTHDTYFTNFIHDISSGGVFIETHAPFYVGQKIALNFSLPGAEGPVFVKGEVIRMDAHGIGVKFTEGDLCKIDIGSESGFSRA